MVKYRSVKKGNEYAILLGVRFYGKEVGGQFRQTRFKTKAAAVKKVRELNKNRK